MTTLQLNYFRKESNVLEACDVNNVLLGWIEWDSLFKQMQFHGTQTKLTNDELKDIKLVAGTLAGVMT